MVTTLQSSLMQVSRISHGRRAALMLYYLNSHKQSGIIISDISDQLPICVVTQYIHKETLNKTCIKKRVIIINDVTKKAFIKYLENCNWDEILAEE